MKENERMRLILQAALCLVSARNLLTRAGALQSAEKVRAALRSTGGALRQ
jgi:hypothetical protein